MLRVGDLQRAIDFYTKVLGMELLRTTDRPDQKYSLAFVGYGRNPEHAEIELTYNYGVDKYEPGTAFGHIAIGVPDAYQACERIRASGGAVTREPGEGRQHGDRFRHGPGRLQDRADPKRLDDLARYLHVVVNTGTGLGIPAASCQCAARRRRPERRRARPHRADSSRPSGTILPEPSTFAAGAALARSAPIRPPPGLR